jgi:hypothetical protein
MTKNTTPAAKCCTRLRMRRPGVQKAASTAPPLMVTTGTAEKSSTRPNDAAAIMRCAPCNLCAQGSGVL